MTARPQFFDPAGRPLVDNRRWGNNVTRRERQRLRRTAVPVRLGTAGDRTWASGVGNGARRLQRRRRRLDLSHPRHGAQQSLSLGRGRAGGHLRSLPVAVFALALWNGRDPILKERAFGLVPTEGNHGEDVKEYYFYLDSTPTHSYMKYLYKYPQTEFPTAG